MLVETIAKITGTPILDIVTRLHESFFSMGGTSLNSIQVIGELRKAKYIISVTDFVNAKTIYELHKCLVHAGDLGSDEEIQKKLQVGSDAAKNFKPDKLAPSMKNEVANLVATSFITKGDLEEYVGLKREQIVKFIEGCYASMVEKGFSYVVRRTKDNKMVAVVFNVDAHDLADGMTSEQDKNFTYILDMIGSGEHAVK